jgi:hypothetical protein
MDFRAPAFAPIMALKHTENGNKYWRFLNRLPPSIPFMHVKGSFHRW